LVRQNVFLYLTKKNILIKFGRKYKYNLKIMKKLFALLMLMYIYSGFSISYAQSNLGVGIKGGINVANQTTTGEGENVYIENLIRFHGGAYFNYFFLDNLAIQPELIVSGKGSKWDDPYNNTRDLLTYIDLPILIKYQPIKLLNIHAGPEFGYMISALQDPAEGDEKIDIKEWYNDIDIGIALGAEANLPYRINITVRYILGLSTVTNDVEYIDPWKNNFIQISLGFRIKGR